MPTESKYAVITSSQSRKFESGPGDCRTGNLATADLSETAVGVSVSVLFPDVSVDGFFEEGSSVDIAKRGIGEE
jgi:hypothetical protein